MNLTETKAALAASLADAGYPVFDHVPERLSPPCIVVTNADPYITVGETFNGDYEINLAVYLTVKSGTNERQVEAMDAMLQAVLPHFEGDQGEPWTVEVGAPIYYSINQNDYLGCRIAASNHFHMG